MEFRERSQYSGDGDDQGEPQRLDLLHYLYIPMKCSLHNTPVCDQFCYHSVPIHCYFQHLIKPLFFNI